MRPRNHRKVYPFLGGVRSKSQLGNVTYAESGAIVLMYACMAAQNEAQVNRRAKSVSMSQLEKIGIRTSSGRSCILVPGRLLHGILSLWEGVKCTVCRSLDVSTIWL
jgi:hypothetical protein